MKADHFRYLSEALYGKKRKRSSAKSEENYKAAIDLAQKSIPSYSPRSLEIFVNYCVFLYDIAQKKDEAIKLAQETYENNISLIDQNSENSSDEARIILKLLEENINSWQTT